MAILYVEVLTFLLVWCFSESNGVGKIFFPVILEPETLDLFFNLYHSLPPLLSQLVSTSHPLFLKDKYPDSLLLLFCIAGELNLGPHIFRVSV